MTEHANCQPEAWSAAARVARELREEVERLRDENRELKAEVRRLRMESNPYAW